MTPLPIDPFTAHTHTGRSIAIGALTALLVLTCLAPNTANAHKEAASNFTARTNGDTIDFDFRLNGTSAVEVVTRALPDIAPPEKKELLPHRTLLLDYIASHVLVTNNGKPCVHQDGSFFQYAERLDRLVVKRPVKCSEPINELTIEAFLFLEEETVHTTISVFHHKRAKEHYRFAGRNTAIISVNKLFQLPERKFSREGYRGVPSGMPSEATASRPGGPVFATPPSIASLFLGGTVRFVATFFPILFLLSLTVAFTGIRKLLLPIGLFLTASLLSMALASRDLLGVHASLAMVLSALTVIFVSLENFLRPTPLSRPAIAAVSGFFQGILLHAGMRSAFPSMESSWSNIAWFGAGALVAALSCATVILLFGRKLQQRFPEKMPRMIKTSGIALSVLAVISGIVAFL